MKKIVFLMYFILVATELSAQVIDLHFPYFAGKEWHYWVFRGNGRDTISGGTLDAAGRARLVLPEAYKGYRGMAQWMLADGGGLSFVVAGEDFSVSCAEAQPGEQNIIYTGTKENDFLKSRHLRQQAIFARINAVRSASGDKDMLPAFENELSAQEQAWGALQDETARSPLYAARFSRIYDFVMGIGRSLPKTEAENAAQLSRFAAGEMDIDALYTSNHWQDALASWMIMHNQVLKDDSLLLTDSRRMLSRCRQDEVYAALSEQMARLYSKSDKDSLLSELAQSMKQSGRLRNTSPLLGYFVRAQAGDAAPQLSQGELPGGKTLLVFYESGCGPCENEMLQLRSNYPLLREKGYEVVSVAADKDAAVFRNTAEVFPWKAKYCDLQGFSGADFNNYGVIGTPAFYVIDGKGIVQGRYARLQDTGLIR